MANNLKQFCKELLALKRKHGVSICIDSYGDEYSSSPYKHTAYFCFENIDDGTIVEKESDSIDNKEFEEALQDFIDAP